MFYKILHGIVDTTITLTPPQHQPVDTANVLLPLLLELTHIQIPSYLLLLICGILYLTY